MKLTKRISTIVSYHNYQNNADDLLGYVTRNEVSTLRQYLAEYPNNLNTPAFYPNWCYYGNFSHVKTAGLIKVIRGRLKIPQIALGTFTCSDESIIETQTEFVVSPSEIIYAATPLHWACAIGHLEVVELLCSMDTIDMEVPLVMGDNRWTAFDIAVLNGHSDIVRFMNKILHKAEF